MLSAATSGGSIEGETREGSRPEDSGRYPPRRAAAPLKGVALHHQPRHAHVLLSAATSGGSIEASGSRSSRARAGGYPPRRAAAPLKRRRRSAPRPRRACYPPRRAAAPLKRVAQRAVAHSRTLSAATSGGSIEA